MQRYAEELHSDLCRVAEVLEAERIKHLLQQGRTVVSAAKKGWIMLHTFVILAEMHT